MVVKDIFTIKDASEILGLNINTFRYRLKKNSDDCDNGIYEVRLYNLLSKVRVMTRSKKANYIRFAERYIILDIDEFASEFKKYEEFLKENKKRKRKRNLGWSNSAIECYERHMICAGCLYRKICTSIAAKTNNIPPMKQVVYKLLSELGLPPKI
ncbi:MAG: hypothetical protein K6A44_05255 [bacterium]|nr:hypothetical protein [bacterium]